MTSLQPAASHRATRWHDFLSQPNQELPMSTPVKKTKRPPIITWNNAEASDVSMNRWRIHEIATNSTRTTPGNRRANQTQIGE